MSIRETELEYLNKQLTELHETVLYMKEGAVAYKDIKEYDILILMAAKLKFCKELVKTIEENRKNSNYIV